MTTTITTSLQSDILSATVTAVGDTFPVPTLGTITSVGFQLSGTFVATFLTEGSVDGQNWVALNGVTPAGAALGAMSNAGAQLAIVLPTAGLQSVRLRCTAFTSGAPQIAATLNGGWMPNLSSTTVTPLAPTPYALNSAATTNNVLVVAAAHTIMALNVSNVAASTRYLKLYNKATAPVLASDTPVLVIPILAGSIQSINTGPLGLRFTLGIGIAITGAAADTDATAVALGDVKVKIDYV